MKFRFIQILEIGNVCAQLSECPGYRVTQVQGRLCRRTDPAPPMLIWSPPVVQVEKAKPFKCATFGATSLQQRHIATGDFEGNLNIW